MRLCMCSNIFVFRAQYLLSLISVFLEFRPTYGGVFYMVVKTGGLTLSFALTKKLRVLFEFNFQILVIYILFPFAYHKKFRTFHYVKNQQTSRYFIR